MWRDWIYTGEGSAKDNAQVSCLHIQIDHGTIHWNRGKKHSTLLVTEENTDHNCEILFSAIRHTKIKEKIMLDTERRHERPVFSHTAGEAEGICNTHLKP